jgi:hypothetical protein
LWGGANQGEPVEVLRAYLQPCMSPTWLLPVDSNFERRTVRQLVSLQRWVLKHEGVVLTVEKPVFDMDAPATLDVAGGTDPHQPVIPDFIVRGSRGRCVVVETMGFDLPAYRARKARLHPAMSRLCRDAPVIEHDFCRPKDWTQEERDRVFWRNVVRCCVRGRPPEGANTVCVRAGAGPRAEGGALDSSGIGGALGPLAGTRGAPDRPGGPPHRPAARRV